MAWAESATCTINNDDIAPKLTVIKIVINDDGGTLVPSDFTMEVNGTNVSNPSFPGDENGTTVTLDAGAYNVTEVNPAPTFYAESFSADCSGTIAVGEEKTCTVTNDDIPLGFGPSIDINNLVGSLDADRKGTEGGSFVVTDESEQGNQNVNTILITSFDAIVEYRQGNQWIDTMATCTFDPDAPVSFGPDNPTYPDNSITIGYDCTWAQPIPNPRNRTVRVTVSVGIFGRDSLFMHSDIINP